VITRPIKTMSRPVATEPSVSRLRAAGCVALLAALSACATRQPPQYSAVQEARQYEARAIQHNYVPPGPPGDPWGPYIAEAAAKYDVPDHWIREVMRAESSGQVYETSEPGAMGLMQVMPQTYDELRQRYALGDDPYDPHDNVMAGAAYMRELYDLYGSPGFLAAYNAGPGRFDDYLSRNRPLPDETRHYVAKIAPNLLGTFPQRLSPASEVAMNQIPMDIPPGPRYPRQRAAPVEVADNRSGRYGTLYHAWTPATAQLVEPPRPVVPLPLPPPVPFQYAANSQPARHGGFHVIPQAVAETVPLRHGGPLTGAWAIQVGAFVNEGEAHSAAEAARGQAHEMLAGATPTVGPVKQPKGTLYRARLTGLSREAAIQACEKLSRGRGACIVISPDARS
jgi:hypothetical protein